MKYVAVILGLAAAGATLGAETKSRDLELTQTLYQMLPPGTYADRFRKDGFPAIDACVIKVSYGDGTSHNMSEAFLVKVSAKYRGAVGEFRMGPAGTQKIEEFPGNTKSQDFVVKVKHAAGAHKGQPSVLHVRRLGSEKWEINVLDSARGPLTPKMCGPLYRNFDMNPDGPGASRDQGASAHSEEACSNSDDPMDMCPGARAK